MVKNIFSDLSSCLEEEIFLQWNHKNYHNHADETMHSARKNHRASFNRQRRIFNFLNNEIDFNVDLLLDCACRANLHSIHEKTKSQITRARR